MRFSNNLIVKPYVINYFIKIVGKKYFKDLNLDVWDVFV